MIREGLLLILLLLIINREYEEVVAEGGRSVVWFIFAELLGRVELVFEGNEGGGDGIVRIVGEGGPLEGFFSPYFLSSALFMISCGLLVFTILLMRVSLLI